MLRAGESDTNPPEPNAPPTRPIQQRPVPVCAIDILNLTLRCMPREMLVTPVFRYAWLPAEVAVLIRLPGSSVPEAAMPVFGAEDDEAHGSTGPKEATLTVGGDAPSDCQP